MPDYVVKMIETTLIAVWYEVSAPNEEVARMLVEDGEGEMLDSENIDVTDREFSSVRRLRNG